jgi:hypothetical protein
VLYITGKFSTKALSEENIPGAVFDLLSDAFLPSRIPLNLKNSYVGAEGVQTFTS